MSIFSFGDDRFVLAPGAYGSALLAPTSSGARRQFKGWRIVNKGDSDGLVITSVFVGNVWQAPPASGEPANEQGSRSRMTYEVPLSAVVEWDLDLCHPGILIAVLIQNKAAEPRRVLFEIHGDEI